MTSAYEKEKARYHKYFTASSGRSGKTEEIRTTPLFSLEVKHKVDSPTQQIRSDRPSTYVGFVDNDSESSDSKDTLVSGHSSTDWRRHEVLPQYGLLGHHIGTHPSIEEHEPILLNVDAPNSAFICGSQGSGKSYTLSAILENCLLPGTDTGKVEKPVAGVVFHYDVNSTPSVAEAAYLCTRGIKVQVFVSQSNERALTQAYKAIDKDGNLEVKPLLFRSSDLSIERMHKLMALSEKDGPVPLYMEVVQRILRQMAITNTFSYANFKAKLGTERLTKDQTGPLSLRLGLLESFLQPSDISVATSSHQTNNIQSQSSAFNLSPGTLTIIDLSDTFIDASTVCILFDITLSLLLSQRPPSGLAIALDEGHKYLNASLAASNFTDRLLTTIREQRHNSTRIYIATQEPTLSPSLLDLCSVSIVHRFTSPAWFARIKEHLGGASGMVRTVEEQGGMFERIGELNVGESLVFAPSAFVVGVERGTTVEVGKLGAVAMKMKTRARLGEDGATSKLASRMGEMKV